MKIIAGKFKNKNLATLEGVSTRPTSGRIKEAVFNSLGQFFTRSEVVLDVFGGSGALSFEALSRGAKHAVIIDSMSEAIQVIKKNAIALGLHKEVDIIKGNYNDILPTLINKHRFDMVFLDPPYSMSVIDEVINFLVDNNLLNHGAQIVAEFSKNTNVPKERKDFTIKKSAVYASTRIMIFVWD